MKYLHTMVRARDLDETLDFYCNKLGLVEVRRHASEAGRFTLVFLAAPGDLGGGTPGSAHGGGLAGEGSRANAARLRSFRKAGRIRFSSISSISRNVVTSRHTS